MPARTVKQQAWIEAMLKGDNPTEAARAAKYAKGTEKHEGHMNTTKQHLMEEILRRRAELAVKSEMTVGRVQAMQQAAYDLAMTNQQPSAAVSAAQAIARLYGLDKQTVISERTPDQPEGKEAEVLNGLNKQYKLRLAGTDTEGTGASPVAKQG